MALWQQAMIGLARSNRVTSMVHNQQRLDGLARRFVGGSTSTEAVDLTRDLHQHGITVSGFFLGEYVTDPTVIAETVTELTTTLTELQRSGLDVCVSVDPTQVGLMIDEASCSQNLETLARSLKAVIDPDGVRRGHDVLMIDMEDGSVTDYTLRLHQELRDKGLPVGVTVQAYLKRSLDDLKGLSGSGSWVRLVKGAFAESEDIAVRGRKSIDSFYRRGVAVLLSAASREVGCYAAFATHDDVIIEEIITLAEVNGWSRDGYEFEMLFGVRPELQANLVERGYRVRVYLPYGKDWFPYAIRRVGESPRNLRFAASALLRSNR